MCTALVKAHAAVPLAPTPLLHRHRTRSRGSRALARGHPGDVSGEELLVVGPGVLGSYLGVLWTQDHGQGTVTGLTQTTRRHSRLDELGIKPLTYEDRLHRASFPNVVFSAPPSASADYPGEVRRALSLWDGRGAFVFTSSAALYAVDDGQLATEASPTVPWGASARTDRLLGAEEAVMEAGGAALRLVGLYHSRRGAHTFYLRKAGEAVCRWGGAVVNLIHYEDASRLALRMLQRPRPGAIAVGVDDEPVTLDELMVCTLASPAYASAQPGALPVQFIGQPGSEVGKRMRNPQTRAAWEWTPLHPSFRSFVAHGAKDWWTVQPP